MIGGVFLRALKLEADVAEVAHIMQRAGLASPVQRVKWWSPELEELREETVRALGAVEERRDHGIPWER